MAAISTTLPSNSLICSSATFILLLIPSSVFFQFSYCIFQLCLIVCYVFSLLKYSCNFSLCASFLLLSSWTIFTIITLNSLLYRFPVSTSLSWSSGVLSYSFIWEITHCLFILVNFLWCSFLSGSYEIVVFTCLSTLWWMRLRGLCWQIRSICAHLLLPEH